MNSAIKEKIQEEKGYLKGLAVNIRNQKHQYKNAQRAHSGVDKALTELYDLQYEYRHRHIAYSIRKKIHSPLLGNSFTKEVMERYNEIERIVRDDNRPNWDYIRKIINSYPSVQEVEDETTVCADAY